MLLTSHAPHRPECSLHLPTFTSIIITPVLQLSPAGSHWHLCSGSVPIQCFLASSFYVGKMLMHSSDLHPKNFLHVTQLYHSGALAIL